MFVSVKYSTARLANSCTQHGNRWYDWSSK